MGEKFSIIVCGSRNFVDKDFLFKKLDFLLQNKKNITIIEGGQKSFDKKGRFYYGADCFASNYAKVRNFNLITKEADWDTHGKAAGPIRNSEMLDLNPDACVGFLDKNSKNIGTLNMLNKATKKGIIVRQYII